MDICELTFVIVQLLVFHTDQLVFGAMGGVYAYNYNRINFGYMLLL